ncbi:MAG: DUF3179 domain-containing protein [Burkholderiaceae bacterium]
MSGHRLIIGKQSGGYAARHDRSIFRLWSVVLLAVVFCIASLSDNGPIRSAFAYTLNGFDLGDALIPEALIKHGGPPRDGIPAIDEPRFLTASQADHLKPQTRVMGIMRNGVAKAYPILIMNWHEIVNDKFADEPVVVTYCPLCGTGMAFEATINNKALTFGVSGLLYNSDVLLYDRQTESLWSQLMVKSVAGPMKTTPLKSVVMAHTSWEDWLNRHPDTLVLSSETGHQRDYQRNPYQGYEDTKTVMFAVRHASERFHPKELVLGLVGGKEQMAWPFSQLRQAGIAGKPVHFIYDDQPMTVEYNDKHKTARLLDSTGTEVPTVISFWFAWYAFYPETRIYEASQ